MPKGQDIVDAKIGGYGSESDLNIFRELQVKFNSKQSFKGDKAFVGGKNISTPHKKPRNRELTQKEKDENKIFSSKRVLIEHFIRLVKIFRIGEQKFRLYFRNYNKVIGVVCGLVRLRLGCLFL